MALPTAAALPGAQEQMAFTKPDICVINSLLFKEQRQLPKSLLQTTMANSSVGQVPYGHDVLP